MNEYNYPLSFSFFKKSIFQPNKHHLLNQQRRKINQKITLVNSPLMFIVCLASFAIQIFKYK